MKLITTIKAKIKHWKLKRRLRKNPEYTQNLKEWYTSGNPQERLSMLRSIARRPGETNDEYVQRVQTAVLKGDIFTTFAGKKP